MTFNIIKNNTTNKMNIKMQNVRFQYKYINNNYIVNH